MIQNEIMYIVPFDAYEGTVVNLVMLRPLSAKLSKLHLHKSTSGPKAKLQEEDPSGSDSK